MLRGKARAYGLEEEAIFGVVISPSFGVLLDQVKEGKKEEKEKKENGKLGWSLQENQG